MEEDRQVFLQDCSSNHVCSNGDFEEVSRKSKFKRICVFCGSRSGYKTVFSQAALDLSKELGREWGAEFIVEGFIGMECSYKEGRKTSGIHVERKLDLVYGGGSVGLMGLISQAVHDGGCHVLGVIPSALLSHQISGDAVGEVMAVSSMHERKAEMARQADAFIALPGGYGTMEELLEMITWSQLGIHDKPVGLLNVDGYYDSLLALFNKGVEEGFIKPSALNIVVSATTAKELIQRMEDYAPVHDCVAPKQSWEEDQQLGSTAIASKNP